MRLFPSLLFGISASLDALLVGISCGLREIRIRTLQNLIISLVSLLGTCLSACLGSCLLPFLSLSLATCIGNIILILLGAYYILKHFFVCPVQDNDACVSDADVADIHFADIYVIDTNVKSTCSANVERSNTDAVGTDVSDVCAASSQTAPFPERNRKLPARETFLLSLALSVNNIGIGLSASMAGLPLLPAAVMTFACSVLFLLGGNRLGQSRFLRLVGDFADPISGLLLIGLGIIQFTL